MSRKVERLIPFGLMILFACAPILAHAQEAAPEISEGAGTLFESLGAIPMGDDKGTLALSEALSLTLEQSPILAAFEWELRAADAMIVQAGLRPNPELSVEIEEVRWSEGPSEIGDSSTISGDLSQGILGIPTVSWERERAQGSRSGIGDSEFTISISQAILLGKKRAKRMALARQEKELTIWEYQAERANVLAQTASDFVEVLAAQEHVRLEEEFVNLAKEVVRIFALRVEAGQVSAIELSRAEVALGAAEVNIEESLRALESARVRLASNWGATEAGFAAVIGRLDEVRQVPNLGALISSATRNPDLARWASELDRREADLALQRAERIPDLTVELGFRSAGLSKSSSDRYGFGSTGEFGYTRSRSGYDSGRDNSLVLGFSLPLPLFNRNQGQIAAAQAMVSRVSDQHRGTEVAVISELIAVHQATLGAYTKASTLQEELLPKVSDTFEKIQRGYQQGKFSYLEVLDTQRTLFDTRESLLEVLTRFHKGIVQIERLTGQTLEDSAAKHNTEIKENENER